MINQEMDIMGQFMDLSGLVLGIPVNKRQAVQILPPVIIIVMLLMMMDHAYIMIAMVNVMVQLC